MEKGKKKFDTFISYSSINQEKVDYIKSILEEHGISCWMAPESIAPGSTYEKDIIIGIKNSEDFFWVLSKNSATSHWCLEEVTSAVSNKLNISGINIDGTPVPTEKEIHFASKHLPLSKNDEDLLVHLKNYIENKIHGLVTNDVFVTMTYDFPNNEYVGRLSELEEIEKSFEHYNTVCIKGIGGIGKSVVARMYVKKYFDKHYLTVAFVPYEGSIKKLIANLSISNFNQTKFLETLAKENNNANIEDALYEKKIEFLKTMNKSTLLVVDGLDNISDPNFNDLVSLPINVLITSRCNFEGVESVETLPLGKEESLKLFKFYYNKTIDEEDIPVVEEILEKSDYHTLTMKLYATYLANKNTNFNEFLNAISKKDSIVLDEAINEEDNYASINSYIRQIFSMSNLNEEEINVLRALAVMPLDGISKNNFMNYLGKDFNVKVFDNLVNKGWISVTNKRVFMHQLIKEIVVKDYKPSLKHIKEFIFNVLEDLQVVKVETFNSIDKSIFIAQSIIDCLDDDGSPEYVDVLYKCIYFMHEIEYYKLFNLKSRVNVRFSQKLVHIESKEIRDKFLKYNKLFKKAYDLAVIRKPDDIKFQYEIMTFYCGSFFNLSMYKEAIEVNKQIIEKFKDYGETSQEIIRPYRRIGLNYYALKDYKEAIKYFEYNLKIALKIEDSAFNIGRCYLNLANAYNELSKNRKALKLYKKALEYSKEDGDSIFGRIDLYMKIGEVENKLHQYKDAIKDYNESLSLIRMYTEDDLLITQVESIIKTLKNK